MTNPADRKFPRTKINAVLEWLRSAKYDNPVAALERIKAIEALEFLKALEVWEKHRVRSE